MSTTVVYKLSLKKYIINYTFKLYEDKFSIHYKYQKYVKLNRKKINKKSYKNVMSIVTV